MDNITNKKITRYLKQLGLSEKESKVYLASLSLGPTTAQNIAETALVKRTTTYNIIEDLRNLGLIFIEHKGFKKYYSPAPPERLKATINEKREILKKTLPDLEALYNLKGDESSIKLFKGPKACQNVYWELINIIKPHDYYYVFSHQDRWYNLDPEFSQKFIEKRAKLNIKIKLLLQDSPIAREHQKFQSNYNEIIKILPEGSPLKTNLIITPQKIVIHQTINPIFAIITENPSIILMNKQMFEIMWNSIDR